MFINEEFRDALDNLLTMALLMQRTQMGTIQLLIKENDTLKIVAHQGFKPAFLEHFEEVTAEDYSACGRALKTKENVFIEDVTSDPFYIHHKAIAVASGFLSVQSTPLISSQGELQGILSTHFRVRRKFTEEELATLRDYAQHAADIISGFIEKEK